VGSLALSDAFAQSINTVAVQVEMRAGISHVIAAAHRLGVTAELGKDASLALGTSEVTLMELTSAYCAFQTAGMGAWPYGIAEIRDKHGNVLYQRTGTGPGRVIAPDIAAEMTQLMTGTIALPRGTGHSAALDRPAAGKTGTTSDYRDAWFMGFTADLVAGVWVGNDDNTPMNKVTGGTLPAQIWRGFMLEANKDLPPRPLPGSLVVPTPGPAIAAAGTEAPAPPKSTSWIESLFGGGSSAVQRTASRESGPAPVIQKTPGQTQGRESR
jgi:penicillin-binding protein 1A